MRYLSLFSGIEAASVAWGPLGWEPMAFCEVDPFASAVLAERFPDVPNLGDVSEVDWRRWVDESGRPDVLVGGSPCQSFSVAGRREGLDGESGLMLEYIRAVRDAGPRWILWENVPGVFSIDSGRAFGTLVDALDELGYGIAWRVLDAQFFGVAQRRRRVFLVGCADGRAGRAAAVLLERGSVSGNTLTSRQKREELAAGAGRAAESMGFRHYAGAGSGSVAAEPETCPTLMHDGRGMTVLTDTQSNACTDRGLCGTLSAHSAKDAPVVAAFAQNSRDEVRVQGDGQICGALSASPGAKQTTYVCELANTSSNGLGVGRADVSPTLDTGSSRAVARCGSIRRLMPVECERLQGFPDGWTEIPWRGRPACRCPDAPRYRAIGNSMAVPVMRWIGERIAICEELEGDRVQG